MAKPTAKAKRQPTKRASKALASKAPAKPKASPASKASTTAVAKDMHAKNSTATPAVGGSSAPEISSGIKTSSSPKPAVVTTQTPVLTAPTLRKKDLLDAVVDRSGMKKKDVKPVVEAMLHVLGEALAENRELNLPPFAKLKIQKVKELSDARVTVARLRQSRDVPKAAK